MEAHAEAVDLVLVDGAFGANELDDPVGEALAVLHLEPQVSLALDQPQVAQHALAGGRLQLDLVELLALRAPALVVGRVAALLLGVAEQVAADLCVVVRRRKQRQQHPDDFFYACHARADWREGHGTILIGISITRQLQCILVGGRLRRVRERLVVRSAAEGKERDSSGSTLLDDCRPVLLRLRALDLLQQRVPSGCNGGGAS